MKDGRIEQIGTPEELLLNPATDYVKEFTESVPRSKVLSVQSIMVPGAAKGRKSTLTARCNEKVEHVAALMLNRDEDITIVDADNIAIGFVPKQRMFEALVDARKI